MEGFAVIKEFVLPRKGVGTNIKKLSLWLGYHATSVSTLGLNSFIAQASKKLMCM